MDAVFFFFTRNVIPPSIMQRSMNKNSILVGASVSGGARGVRLCGELLVETSGLMSLLCSLTSDTFES